MLNAWDVEEMEKYDSDLDLDKKSSTNNDKTMF